MSVDLVPVVHLDSGRFPEFPGEDPERVLTSLARRFGRVVVVDVAGVKRNDADLEFVSSAARRRALWVDAGSRFATDAMDLFVAGAEAVTLRWNTLDSPAELEEAAEMCQPGSLFLGLEFPRRGFLKNPRDARSPEEVARMAEGLGVGLVMIAERPGEDELRGFPAATTRWLQGSASGETLQAMGFAGALVPAAQLPKEEPA